MKVKKLLEVRFYPLIDGWVNVHLFYDRYIRLVKFTLFDLKSYDMLLNILGLVSAQVHTTEYYVQFTPGTRYFRIISNVDILKLPFTSSYVDKTSDLYYFVNSLV